MAHLIYQFEYYEKDLNRNNSVKVECVFMNNPSIRIGVHCNDNNTKQTSWGGIGECAYSTQA